MDYVELRDVCIPFEQRCNATEPPVRMPFLISLIWRNAYIGERPAIVHLRDFGLKSFTSGSVCVAPRGSMKILQLLKAKKYDEAEKIRAAYIPLEDQRDARGPIRVLHDAVTLAGIADMGPMLPMISNLDAAERPAVQAAAAALLAHDRKLAGETLPA